MNTCRMLGVWLFLFGLGYSPVFAIPLNTRLFCEQYPQTSLCRQGATACQSCHSQAPALQSYGQDLQRQLINYPDYDKSPAAFQRYLKPALSAIESLDSDGDSFSNRQEIDAGTSPADPNSRPGGAGTGAYDRRVAWMRVHLQFCGESPSEQSLRDIIQLSQDQARQSLHTALDRCLQSRYWKEEGLPRLADDKIRPSKAVGIEGDPFVIGDFYYDYRLFTHILSEDRDMRELLLAQYHIDAAGRRVEGPIPDTRIPGKIVVGNGQPLEVGRRYGMITTQWFLSANTMFAELPRNTASQAYRAYLGWDIAKSEGLYPVSGEPRDVDHKGVREEACAFCHSTLDPLSYAFSPYLGLRSFGSGLPVGAYFNGRQQWEGDSWVFGEPVQDLGGWVQTALASEAFAQNLTRMLMGYAIGHKPQSQQEQEDFARLWPELPRLGFSANRLLHQVIDTPSFGSNKEWIWKRSRILEADLARALTLNKSELCKELDRYSCVESVHLYALGGNDPFAKTQYTPMEKASQLSTIAAERVVSQACLQRLHKDALDPQSAKVFAAFELDRTLAELEEADVREQIQILYRRFLVREAKPQELSDLLKLQDKQRFGSLPSRDLAHALCVAVGTQLEFLFY